MNLRTLARFAIQKVASDPKARAKAEEAARVFADEAKQVAHEKDRAYAAGKAFRRTLNKLRE